MPFATGAKNINQSEFTQCCLVPDCQNSINVAGMCRKHYSRMYRYGSTDARTYPLRRHNLIGQTFGRLKVIANADSQGSRVYWLCVCDCGNKKAVAAVSLKLGLTRSCGCLQKERVSEISTTHQKTHSPIYRTWAGMIQRCTNHKNPKYSDYGGRGIKVCDRWRVFENFYEDMGDKPSPKHELDRINNNGDYELDNCRWAIRQEQTRNTRQNRMLTYNGETHCVADWSDILGISTSIIYQRLHRGCTDLEALTIKSKTMGGK